MKNDDKTREDSGSGSPTRCNCSQPTSQVRQESIIQLQAESWCLSALFSKETARDVKAQKQHKKHIFRDIQHSIAGRHKFDRVMWVSLSGNKEKKSLMGKMTNLIFFATYRSPPMIQRWSRNPLDRPTLFVRHYFVHTCQSRGRRWFSQWLLLLCFY